MTEKVEIVIEAEDNASKPIDKVGVSLGDLAKVAGGFALAAGFDFATKAMGKLAGVVVDFVKEAAASQEVDARMRAQLNALGSQAHVTAKDINTLADQLSKISGFDDEALVQGQATLLRFGTLSKEQFQQAARAATDLAAVTGMDLVSAFQQVGIALDNPEQGFGRLRRQIGDLTDAQKAEIKVALEMGDIAKAQGLILDALTQKTKGAAEAMGNTFTGQINKLNTQIGNIKEAIGGALLPTIQMFADKLLAFVQSDQFGMWVSKIVDWLTNKLPIAVEQVSTIWTTRLQPAFEKMWPVLRDFVFPALLELVELLAVILPPAITLFLGGWKLIYDAIEFITRPIRAAIDGLTQLWAKLEEFVNKLIPWSQTKFQEVGKAIVTGIWMGITMQWGTLAGNLPALLTTLLQLSQAQIGAGSPSKLWRDKIGKPMAQGVQVGFDQQMGQSAKPISNMLSPSDYVSGGRGMTPAPVTVVLNYSPAVSIASRAEAEGVLGPYINDVLRQLRK